MAKGDLRRRLAALENAVRPNNSVAARIAQLAPDERETFERWKVSCQQWHARFSEPDGAYKAFLDGDAGPRLPRYLSEKLHGQTVTLTVNMSEDQMKDAYRDFTNSI